MDTGLAVLPPIVKEFADVFNGVGKLPVEHDIRLLSGDRRVDPVICAASRVPFKLEERVFRKLDQMVADRVITPVTEPTEWVSRMMIVGKPDGDVRICLDPSELNKAIQRQHFTVPTVDQLFAKICSFLLQSGRSFRILSNSSDNCIFLFLHDGYSEKPLSLPPSSFSIEVSPGSVFTGHV